MLDGRSNSIEKKILKKRYQNELMNTLILGDWRLVKTENFQDFLKEMGINIFWRKVVRFTKPNQQFIKINDNEWLFVSHLYLKTIKIKFRLNEEFDETIPDGRLIKSCFKMEGNSLIQTQKDKDGNLICRIMRQISKDGDRSYLKTILSSGSVRAVLWHEKYNLS